MDNMLTYSLKAIHVGAHTACHMTANIRLMSYSKLRVDAHVILNIGCFYSRSVRNGLSVATHMDGEAPDQDRSRKSEWFTVRPRKFITLGHVSIATGWWRARPGSFPSLVRPPAIRILFCVQCNTSPASFMHFWTGRFFFLKKNNVSVFLNDACNTLFRYNRLYSNLKSCTKLRARSFRTYRSSSSTLSTNRISEDKRFSRLSRCWTTSSVMFFVFSLQTLDILHPICGCLSSV